MKAAPALHPGRARDVARRVERALFDAALARGDGHDAPLTVPRAAAPIAPALLAAAHPGSDAVRATMAAVYARCLAHYRHAVAGDAPADDLAAAAAHFVAANLQVLHGTPADPAVLPALARQLAALLRPVLAAGDAGTTARQLQFEKLAILAVLIGESAAQAARQGAPAQAHVRRAARGYLRELLGLDPDRLALGPRGLAWREPAHA